MPDINLKTRELNIIPHWYALYTMHHHEQKVCSRLEAGGIQCYLPLNVIYRRWSDRLKKVNVPLFSCYVFVFLALKDRYKTLQTEGAIRLVSFNGSPAPIPEKQINDIKRILNYTESVENVCEFVPGQHVRILHGPLKDIEGVVLTCKNKHRLVISVDAINQAISVEIDHRILAFANC